MDVLRKVKEVGKMVTEKFRECEGLRRRNRPSCWGDGVPCSKISGMITSLFSRCKKLRQCLVLQLENNGLDTSQPGFISSL